MRVVTFCCSGVLKDYVKKGVRLILRYKLGKMTIKEESPKLLPTIA